MRKVSGKLVHYVTELAPFANVHFLDLARHLRDLLDADPSVFHDVVQKTGIGRRKAYYLVAVDKAFRKLKVPKQRLLNIGWTKLTLLANHITQDNSAQLLKMAETHNARELQQALEGQEVERDAKVVMLYFNDDDYAKFADALVKFGAKRARRGLSDKEQAIIAMIDAVG